VEALTRFCAGRCRLCGFHWIARDPVTAARDHLAACIALAPVTYLPPTPRAESIWVGAR